MPIRPAAKAVKFASLLAFGLCLLSTSWLMAGGCWVGVLGGHRDAPHLVLAFVIINVLYMGGTLLAYLLLTKGIPIKCTCEVVFSCFVQMMVGNLPHEAHIHLPISRVSAFDLLCNGNS
jgi:hypothetical protein